MRTPEVTAAFTEEESDTMLDPHCYLGLAPQFADRVVEKWSAKAAEAEEPAS